MVQPSELPNATQPPALPEQSTVPDPTESVNNKLDLEYSDHMWFEAYLAALTGFAANPALSALHEDLGIMAARQADVAINHRNLRRKGELKL